MAHFQETDICTKIDRIYTAFCAKKGAEFNFSGESHDFWELVYVIDGVAGFMADSNIYELNRGDIIFHKPFEFHRIWSLGNCGISYMVISFDASGENILKLRDAVFHVCQCEQALIESLIKQISENSGNTKDELRCYGTDEISFSRFVFTLDLLITECFDRFSEGKEIESVNSSVFNNAVRYMKRDLSRNPSNAELAKQLNVSTSTLKRVFNKYAKLGVHEYLLQLKISEAKKLLRSGCTVCEISETLGFSNQNYFSTVFKRCTGVSPTKY